MEYPQITQITEISAKRLSVTVEPETSFLECTASLTGRRIQGLRQSLHNLRILKFGFCDKWIQRISVTRLLRPLMKRLAKPSHMYPVGFLFGLGFETATEIALLQVSASSGAKGQSLMNVMVLPVLFAAGMTLVDSADGMIMVGAYNWAFINPIRKLYYNLTITFVSVVVGVVVGGIELIGLIKDGAAQNRRRRFRM
jgi:HoxN/HupN/NixA family high-affinity nickel-transporter